MVVDLVELGSLLIEVHTDLVLLVGMVVVSVEVMLGVILILIKEVRTREVSVSRDFLEDSGG